MKNKELAKCPVCHRMGGQLVYAPILFGMCDYHCILCGVVFSAKRKRWWQVKGG